MKKEQAAYLVAGFVFFLGVSCTALGHWSNDAWGMGYFWASYGALFLGVVLYNGL